MSITRSRLILAIIAAALLAALGLAVASTISGQAHPVAQQTMAVVN